MKKMKNEENEEEKKKLEAQKVALNFFINEKNTTHKNYIAWFKMVDNFSMELKNKVLTLKRVTVTDAVLLKAQCGISGGKSWMEYAIAQCEKEKEQENEENDDEEI